MNEKHVTVQNTGIGFSGLLLLILVCAKIFGIAPVASWSWVWVLAPLWIPLAIVFLVMVVILFAYMSGMGD